MNIVMIAFIKLGEIVVASSYSLSRVTSNYSRFPNGASVHISIAHVSGF